MKNILMQYMTEFSSLSEKHKQAIYDSLRIEEYKKGTLLLCQGDVPVYKCYFVLRGCIRKYYVDVSGKENTTNFFAEQQAIPIFNDQNQNTPSKYSYITIEDSLVVVGELVSENQMYHKFPELETMVRKMMEINIGEAQDHLAEFMQSSPEERYKSLIKKQPQLVDRVPQHQLASYLGITPESLSRIKKRLNNDKNESVTEL